MNRAVSDPAALTPANIDTLLQDILREVYLGLGFTTVAAWRNNFRNAQLKVTPVDFDECSRPLWRILSHLQRGRLSSGLHQYAAGCPRERASAKVVNRAWRHGHPQACRAAPRRL